MQEKPEVSADSGLNNGISIFKMKQQVNSMNKQASLKKKKKQALVFWMSTENTDEKGSQEVIYTIPLSTDVLILSLVILY